MLRITSLSSLMAVSMRAVVGGVVCSVGFTVSSVWACGPQAEVHLSGCFLIDDFHGTQVVGQVDPVIVGLPARFQARFEFALDSSLQLPEGGFAVPALGLLWRVNDPAAGPLWVYREEQGLSYAPELWMRAPSEFPAIQLIRFGAALGTGVCRVDIPLGRALPDRLYPSLNANQGSLDLAIGLAAELDVDPQSAAPSGVMFTAHESFPTEAPAVIVDIFNPRPVPGERNLAAVTCREVAAGDQTLVLRSSVEGMLHGLVETVTIPAGERLVQIAYLPLHEGTYQLEVLSLMDGGLVGYSTLVHVSHQNDLAPASLALDSALAAAPSILPQGYSPEAEYQSSQPLELEMSIMEQQHEPWTDWRYECKPARGYDRHSADYCGECHQVPLTESEKPNCAPGRRFWWLHRCVRVPWIYPSPLTSCQEFQDLLELNLYEWTGSRGEYTCAGYELTFGQWVECTIGIQYAKSCCTYKLVPGETSSTPVPNCRTIVH